MSAIHESPESKKDHLDEDHIDDDLAIKPTQTAQTAHHDVVFGEITEDGPNYRNVHTESYLQSQTKLTLP